MLLHSASVGLQPSRRSPLVVVVVVFAAAVVVVVAFDVVVVDVVVVVSSARPWSSIVVVVVDDRRHRSRQRGSPRRLPQGRAHAFPESSHLLPVNPENLARLPIGSRTCTGTGGRVCCPKVSERRPAGAGRADRLRTSSSAARISRYLVDATSGPEASSASSAKRPAVREVRGDQPDPGTPPRRGAGDRHPQRGPHPRPARGQGEARSCGAPPSSRCWTRCAR